MNKNIIKIILVLIIIFIAYYFIGNRFNEPAVNKELEKSQQVKQMLDEDSIDESVSLLDMKILPTTNFIDEFNMNLPKYFDYMDNNSRVNELGEFTVKQRENSDDVVNKIKEYLGDVEKYQIQLASLQILQCTKSKERIKNLQKSIGSSKSNLSEMSFNAYYFALGLSESKFCDRSGTNQDIFWAFLKLARNGNELAQLELLENLMWAVNLKRINIQKYPLEYMNLRDEAINYLASLAKRGVHRASDKIGRLYNGTLHDIVKPDPLLAYYFLYLAKTQDSFEPVTYQVNLNTLYNKLTDKQKAIADRRTENL